MKDSQKNLFMKALKDGINASKKVPGRKTLVFKKKVEPPKKKYYKRALAAKRAANKYA